MKRMENVVFVIHLTNSKPFIDEEGRIKVYARDKYQLSKEFKVDFGCDIDEFEEDRYENIVKFLEKEKILNFFKEMKKAVREKFKDKNIKSVTITFTFC